MPDGTPRSDFPNVLSVKNTTNQETMREITRAMKRVEICVSVEVLDRAGIRPIKTIKARRGNGGSGLRRGVIILIFRGGYSNNTGEIPISINVVGNV